jgi:plastocyanin
MYFTQAGAGAGGYIISDDDGLAFWSSFRRLGGVSALGYPSSRRFSIDGFTYQATQTALLQWRPEVGTAVLGNTFELLQTAGRDDWLEQTKGIPRPAPDDGSATYDEAVRSRMGWLTEPAIRNRYLERPDAARALDWTERDSIQLYGLPMSRPERHGPFIAQRFQRVAFQLWVDAVPGMPAPGSVTSVLGGDLLKEAGLIYGVAASPHSASTIANRPVSLTVMPMATPTSPVTSTPAGAARGVSAVGDRPADEIPGSRVSPRTPAPSASAVVPGTSVATPRPTNVQVLEGTLSEYSIYLPRLTVHVGTVRLLMTNTGTVRHNLRITGPGVDRKTADLRGGQAGQMEVTFAEPGSYDVYCDIGDHPERGMTLTFTVEA